MSETKTRHGRVTGASHRSPCTLHFTRQPRPSKAPVPHHAARGNSEHLRRLLHAEPAEELHLNDASFALVHLFQSRQCIVQRDQFAGSWMNCVDGVFQINTLCVSAPLVRKACARSVHQDSPHDLSRHSVKMRPILPLETLNRSQAQIGFIHHRRRLECVPFCMLTHVPPRQSPQFLINQGRQPIERRVIPTRPGSQ
jgi:hypothetical protein